MATCKLLRCSALASDTYGHEATTLAAAESIFSSLGQLTVGAALTEAVPALLVLQAHRYGAQAESVELGVAVMKHNNPEYATTAHCFRQTTEQTLGHPIYIK